MPLNGAQPLNREWMLRRLPHQGRMCLLDEVVHWDLERVCCRSASHRAADHPLRAHGRLGVACGIEYAAQAMAVHGVLIGGAAAGLLISVREVSFEVARLDDLDHDLFCEATRIAAGGGTVLYEFLVRGATPLLRGRAGLLLEPAGPA